MVPFDVYLRQSCDFIRLQAWYVWHLHVQRGLPHGEIFGNQLVRFLYEPGGTPNEAAWDALQGKVLDECRRHGKDPDTKDLEQRVLTMVRAFVDDRYVTDTIYARYRENVRKATPYFGFTHGIENEQLILHFTNTVGPDSPLRHVPELRRGLARLVAGIRSDHPGVSVVYCGTWLNSVPSFSGLFPPAWLEGAETSPPAGHGGWWGQFTDRTGALHSENTRYLRQTGSFRHPFLRCACSVDDLRRHLVGDGAPHGT